MNHGLRLIKLPKGKYSEYRYEVIFNAYKWDPQVNDSNTVSDAAIIMSESTQSQLIAWSEQLYDETVRMENALIKEPRLAKELSLPYEILKQLKSASNYEPEKNIRLMRFDFHPTVQGWAISEVNGDVPGGFAEASVLPQIAARYFQGGDAGLNAAQALCDAFKAKVEIGGTIAFVHCTSYADDRQVMECLADCFSKNGYKTIFAAPDHLKFVGNKAFSILEGSEGEIDGIVRFFPLEWLPALPKSAKAEQYYRTHTASCNHPATICAQSKRLPLVWNKLGMDFPVWKELLPETACPKSVKASDADWIFKPALGRVGEGISIKEAIEQKEYNKILKAVKKFPKGWIAQKKFASQPLTTEDNEDYHLCIGVFVIDGKCAGFYGRISPYPRIDSNAKDIPILIEKS